MFSDAAAEMVLTSTNRRTTTSDPRAIAKKYNIPSIVAFVVPTDANEKHVARYKRVALQFPDELLSDCVLVVEQLREALKIALTTAGEGSAALEPPPAVPHVFVLADTTFASCCPDETTAQHYNADVIVHFGYACMSKSTRLPVLYVHQEEALDVEGTAAAVEGILAQSSAAAAVCATAMAVELVVFAPPAMAVHMPLLCKALSQRIGRRRYSEGTLATPRYSESVVVASTIGVHRLELVGAAPLNDEQVGVDAAWTEVVPDNGTDWIINGVRIPSGRAVAASSSSDVTACHQRLLYVGHVNDPHVAQLCMLSQYWLQQKAHDDAFISELDRQRGTNVHQPTSAMVDISSTNALLYFLGTESALNAERTVQQRLRQRMFNVEALKGAASIGILVASLSIEGFQQTAEVLKRAVRAASSAQHPRRAYIIYVGHLNEFKVNNFVDSIDCFIAIACPNAKECHFPTKQDGFLKPVASPSELLIALGALGYDHPYAFTTNFRVLLDVATKFIAEQKQLASEGNTGAHREDAGSSALIRSSGGALSTSSASSTAIQRLYERSYVGLEQKIGETAVQSAVDEGRQGIARGYKTERISQAPAGASESPL